MFSIIVNELKKPFYQRFFRWLLIIILAAHAVFSTSLLIVQKPYIEYGAKNITPEYYEKRMDSICAEAEINKHHLLRFNVTENDFAYRYQDAVIERYTHMKEVVEILPDYSGNGWSAYFRDPYFHVFSAVGSLVLVCSIIIYDRQYGMWSITRTTKHGRTKVYIAKILSVFILSFLLAVISQLTVLVSAWNMYGLSDPSVDIQNVPAFLLSSFDGSVSDLFLFTLLQRSLIIATYSLVVAAIAAISGRYFITLLSGAAIYGIGYVISYLPISSAWRYLNFIDALDSVSLFSRYEAVNVFSVPVNVLAVCALALLAFICGAIILIFIGLSEPLKQGKKRFSFIIPKRTPKLFVKRRYRSLSLVRQELYKVFSPAVIFAIILAFGFHVYNDNELFAHNESYTEKTLKEYTEVLSKMSEDEQTEYIVAEFAHYSGIVNAEKEMTDLYFGSQISSEEFIEYNKSLAEARARLTPLSELQSRVSYLQKTYQEKGLRGELAFDYSTEALLSGTSPIALLICVILFSSTVAAVDYRKKEGSVSFEEILSVTKYGRTHTLKLKLKILCTACAVFALSFHVTDMLFCIFTSSDPQLFVPLVSFPEFASTDSAMTVLSWYVIEVILKTVFSSLLGLFCFCTMYSVRNSLYGYVVILMAVLLPRLLSHMGLSFLSYIDPLVLFSDSELYSKSSLLWSFDYGLTLIYLALVSLSVLFFTVQCGKRCEKSQ